MSNTFSLANTTLLESKVSQNSLQMKKTFADIVVALKEAKVKSKKRSNTLKKIKDTNSSQEWNSSENSNTSLINRLMKKDHDVFNFSRLRTTSNINTLKSTFCKRDSK
jgi:hypothetical protein